MLRRGGARTLTMVLGSIGLVASQFASPSVRAEATCDLNPAFKPYYHLELSASATYCKAAKEDPSCARFPKISPIQLHGLWVDYAQGKGVLYPTGKCAEAGCELLDGKNVDFCQALPDLPTLYQSSAWKEKGDYFAGREKCLERHEWVKHGACSPMTPEAWASWSLAKTAEIATKLKLPADRPIFASQFDEAVRRRLPELDGAFRVKCVGAYLSSLSVDFDWGVEPGAVRKRRDGRTEFVGCDSAFILPSRP